MRKSVTFGIIVAIIALSISISVPAFAQVAGPTNPNANVTTAYKLLHGNGTNATTSSLLNVPPLTVKTDLPSYQQGDAVIVTGNVREAENATALTLRVFSSLKNLISIAQLLPASDGSFTKTFLATGPLWKDAGNYTIVAQYGRYTQANATFYYGGGNGESIVRPPITSTYQLTESGVTYNIPYTIKGGKVNSMNIYADKLTLEISITAQTDGALVIDLPRAMIDAKVPANLTKDQIMTGEKIDQSKLDDDKFIVAVNQKPTTYTETKDSNSRTLSIPFHAGDTTIDIVGTTIVPEFGPIAALVLAIAIVSIIAVSAKTGLRLMPRY